MRGKYFCRGCNSKLLFEAIDLGFSPLANKLLNFENLEEAETWYPLKMRICENCSLGQVGEFSEKSDIFLDYPYLSSTSSSWLEVNKLFADEMTELLELTENDLVLELASNDGYLLKYFLDKGIKVLGVEPALNVSTLAAIQGIPTSPEFFSHTFAKNLLRKSINPRLIVAKNVIAHVPDLRDVLSGISEIADEETLIVFEFPNLLNIMHKMQFDTIYHEHFSYLSATFFEKLLPEFGLKIAGLQNIETHGGSLRLFILKNSTNVSLESNFYLNLENQLKHERKANITSREVWKNISIQIQHQLEKINSWINDADFRIIGYGAAAKSVTLLSTSQVKRLSVPYCIDNSEAKIGKFLPGSHTKVVSENDYFQNLHRDGDVFLIFPWNIEKELTQRIRMKKADARVFIALPDLKEIEV